MLNLFLVGAARSGTTTLWRLLQKTDSIFMPENFADKEPAYFSSLKKSRFKKTEKYNELFKNSGNNKFIGEASTAYLTDPSSALKIFNYNPQAKIIVVLRNPVDRAYSLYNWMSQNGYEYIDTFSEALDIEKKRCLNNESNYFEFEYYYNYLYFNSGLYYKQVKRYLDIFKKNVLLLKFEDLMGQNSIEIKRISEFLDLEIANNLDIKTNTSQGIFSSKVQFILRKITNYCLRKIFNLQEIDKKSEILNILLKEIDFHQRELSNRVLLTTNELEKIKELIFVFVNKIYKNFLKLDRSNLDSRETLIKMGWNNSEPNLLSNNIRKKLMMLYKVDIKNLSNLTGMDFSIWNN